MCCFFLIFGSKISKQSPLLDKEISQASVQGSAVSDPNRCIQVSLSTWKLIWGGQTRWLRIPGSGFTYLPPCTFKLLFSLLHNAILSFSSSNIPKPWFSLQPQLKCSLFLEVPICLKGIASSLASTYKSQMAFIFYHDNAISVGSSSKAS